MKHHILFLFAFTAFLPLSISAQSNQEDVIYLKNGSVYRGTILDQVPGVSYRIEIAGGSVIYIVASEVEKIGKDQKVPPSGKPRRGHSRGKDGDYEYEYVRMPKPDFHYRATGYFFQVRASGGMNMGISVINGFKYGQFGLLGVGVGISGAIVGVFGDHIPGNNAYEGPFGTLFVYYGGDVLKKPVTPYYNVYAGYGFNLQPHQFDGDNVAVVTSTGGPMGGVSIGVRIYNRVNRANIGWALNFDMPQCSFSEPGYVHTGGSGAPSGHPVLLIPGSSVSVGF